jgi:hypothetical protein
MDKHAIADIYRIGINETPDSIPMDDNFQELKDMDNDVIDALNALPALPAGNEVTLARLYHTNLKQRLDSDWDGNANYMKYGGDTTLDSTARTVDVTAGEAKINGIDVKWSADTTNAIALTAVNTRYDVVVVNSDATITVQAGSESATPILPAIVETQKALCVIEVSPTSITIHNDARNQGAWYYTEGRYKYEWKIQDAIDDIDSGTIIAGVGKYYEELNFTDKADISIRFNMGAQLYRKDASSYAIKSINSRANPKSNIEIVGGYFLGNSQAGAYELVHIEYTDDLRLFSMSFDGNVSSTATYKNLYVLGSRQFVAKRLNLYNGTEWYDYNSTAGIIGCIKDGYFIGQYDTHNLYNNVIGGMAAGVRSNIIEHIRTDSISSNNAIDTGNLSVARSGTGAVRGTRYGFAGGGDDGTSSVDTIDYIALVTEIQNSADVGNLSLARESLAGVNGHLYGFFGGGNTDDVSSNVIDHIDLLSVSQNAIDVGNLTLARDHIAGVSGRDYGYYGGGYSASEDNIIEYIDLYNTVQNFPVRHTVFLLEGIQVQIQ